MSFIDKFLVKIFTKKVGKDEFGNEYRTSFFKNYLGKNKRLIIYNGIDISSKVPPMWHAWLHYMTNEIPNDPRKSVWQKDYQPNLTGTKHAYEPSKLSDKMPVYKKWIPK